MPMLLALAIVILAAFGIVSAGLGGEAVLSMATNVPPVPPNPRAIVPTNVNTWPKGDKIWDCCRAIAIAEGYNVAGSNPAKLNNPGDISDGRETFGSEYHSGSNVTKFPTAETGWQWLYTKVNNAANGTSSVYDASMSWNEIGELWAPPNAEEWAANVSAALGVDPDSSLGDYVGHLG